MTHRAIPPRPATTARQFSSTEVPSAEIAPSPVTAMRVTRGPGSGRGRRFGAGFELVHQLSQRLAIGVDEATQILDRYFLAFPSVRSYMEATVTEAKRRGYTQTERGRRRYLPELTSSNFRVRQAAERQAMNAGIQGLAADIFKAALVNLDRAFEDSGLESRIVLQVHDEIIVEAPTAEHDRAHQLTLQAMNNAYPLDVPLEVNIAWGSSWADAKSV